MGWNDHIDFDEERELAGVLNYLIETGTFEDDPDGLEVATLVVDEGSTSLAPDQMVALDAIKRAHFVAECARCQEEVPISEMIQAFDTGMCGYCAHVMSKDD